MAKKAWIERNARKAETVKKYAAIRAELKAKRDYAGLAKLPRDASPIRLANRCSMSGRRDRKSTRLNSSHLVISYAVFCLKKKKIAKHSCRNGHVRNLAAQACLDI